MSERGELDGDVAPRGAAYEMEVGQENPRLCATCLRRPIRQTDDLLHSLLHLGLV